MDIFCGNRVSQWFALMVAGSFVGGTLSMAASPGANPTSEAYQTTANAFSGGKGKFGALGRLGFDLQLLNAEYAQHVKDTPNAQFKPSNGLTALDSGDSVAVDIAAAGDPVVLAEKLKRLGLRNVAVAGHSVGGWLPISSLTAAGLDPDIQFIRPSYFAHNSGTVMTQGDVAQRSDLVRALAGTPDGTGSKVGVISDSFQSLSNSVLHFSFASQDVLSGDLPGVGNPAGHLTPVQVLADTTSGTDEGRAMLQIVHDIAPGATLAFATAIPSVANMANQIKDLKAAGCNVIIDDILFFGESMFQDGIIAQAVDTVVAGGASYFSSAGNNAAFSYEAPFRHSPSNLTTFAAVGYDFSAHNFDPGGGVDVFQAITIPTGRTILVLQWDQPFFATSGLPGATSDLDIILLSSTDPTTATAIAASANANFQGNPVEVLSVVNAGVAQTLQMVIGNTFSGNPSTNFGPEPGRIKVVAFSGSGFAFNEYNTSSSTCFGHANAAGAIAVGAAFYGQTPAFGTAPPLLESFSSRGGTPILIGTNGATLPSPVVRLAPAITAPDGGATTNVGVNFNNFFGTSAAAPHAGAVAALLQNLAGGILTPAQIRSAMTSTAINIGPVGFDFDSGSGLLDALAAATTPITLPDTVQREPNRNLKIAISQLLANDINPDLSPLTFVGTSPLSALGAAVGVNGSFITYLAPVANSTDTFSYIVTDGSTHRSTNIVTVNVGLIDDLLLRPNVVSIVMSPPDVILNFVGIPGRTYRVQFTTSVSLPAPWTDLSGVLTAAASGRFTFTDFNPPSPVRMYRAIEVP